MGRASGIHFNLDACRNFATPAAYRHLGVVPPMSSGEDFFGV